MIRQDEFDWACKKLELIGQKLKLLSIVLLTATLMNWSMILSALGDAIYLGKSFTSLLSIIAAFMVFFLALLFDSLRKDGKAYYDEISGVLHANSKNSEMELNEGSIIARVAIRKFMNSYEIPLVPGKYGPGVLVILNLAIVVLWISSVFRGF